MNAIAWLDHVLTKRSTKRLKYATALQTRRVDASSNDRGYVGLENIESWTGRFIEADNGNKMNDGEAEAQGTATGFEVGDVLFGKLRPYLAKAMLAENNGICSTELLVLKPGKELNARFLFYILLCPQFVALVDSSTFGVKMPRANWDFIGAIQVPLPSLPVQRCIAGYLDTETAQLDALVAEKEQMLALLEEKRAALVSRAVTQGLNPDVPLKPSGLDWLGDIPVHWDVKRLKHFAKIGNGSTPNRDNPRYWEGGDYPWLNSSVVNSRKVEEASRYVTEEALTECHLPKISPPALLVAITGQGKTRGKSAVLKFEATINQHLAFIKPEPDGADCLYLSLLLDTAYSFIRSDSESAGSTRGAITCEQLSNFYVTLPPREEQSEILSFVEEQISTIGSVEETLRRSISLLKERRSALITAAVKGQLAPEAMSA